MPTLAFLLHEPAAGKVRQWWARLETSLNLRGIRRIPFPHVTLLGFERVPFPWVQDLLARQAERWPPLRVRTVGLGLFLRFFAE